MLIVMVVLMGLLGVFSLPSVATLGDCSDSNCTTAVQTCCDRYKSDSVLSPDAIAAGSIKLPSGHT